MKELLTIVSTTHIHEYAPSIEILEKNLKSSYNKFKGIKGCKHVLYIDSKEKNEIYNQYVKNILDLINTKFQGIEVIDSPNSGLRLNYWHAINTCSTPYMLFIEHDWDILHPIDTPKVLEVMEKYDFVNLVKLPKRANMIEMDIPSRIQDYIVEAEPRIKELDLTKTSSFATNPHIIKKSKFLNEWKYHLTYPGSDPNSIELPLFDKYRDEINMFGFEEVHNKWGCYNYGPPSGLKYLEHLDASKSGKL
tara:strand:- start:899 stop:1645 length:747 start_codon:yes stop_codon:yes gene_type:complete